MGRLVRHGRHQGDRCGATADDQDALACIVKILGPMLGVHQLPFELTDALELRREAFVVTVVARGREQPFTGEGLACACAHDFDVNRPAGIRRGPRCRAHFVVIANLAINAMLLGRLAQIVENRAPIGNGLVVHPRLELIAKGMQVRVGPNAGITKQVPRTTRCAARLKDGKGFLRLFFLQVVARTDAGQPRPDDQDINMLHSGKWVNRHRQLLEKRQTRDDEPTWCGFLRATTRYKTHRLAQQLVQTAPQRRALCPPPGSGFP